jgi:hypothetical protein
MEVRGGYGTCREYRRAIRYVVDEQGEKMAVFEAMEF